MNKTTFPVKILPISMILAFLLACSLVPQPGPAPAIGEPQIPESEVPRVSLEDAYAAYQSGSAVFVDARSAEAYAAAHIPGALSIPADEIESRRDELDPAQWIITYCT